MVLMLLVSVATVASFEAVGSVLVITALLVPASTATTLHRSSQESDSGQCPGRPRLCNPRLSAEHLDSTSLARRIFESFGNNYGGEWGCLCGFPHVFSPRHGYWVQWARTRQLADQVAIEDVVVLLYKSHETAATFPWSTIDPRILALASKRACFNHLLLVNTFSLTRDGPWPLKSRPGGHGGSRIWSPKWGWPLIMLGDR